MKPPALKKGLPNLYDPRIRKVIRSEADRQIEDFNSCYNNDIKHNIVHNIIRMLHKGAARIEGQFPEEEILFWDPWKNYYHKLDEELNNNLLQLISILK